MQLTLPTGECRVHVSLTRPERRLIMGCDADKLYDILTLGLISIFAFHTWYSVLFAIVLFSAGISFLVYLGRLSPYFFPIYKRAAAEQRVYLRSAHMNAPIRKVPDQQQA